MARAIPHNADQDPSYVVKAGITDADGNTYYVKRQPATPITQTGQGPGAAPVTAPAVTVKRDDDHRVPASPHAGP